MSAGVLAPHARGVPAGPVGASALPKLKVGATTDPLEREADEIADRAMRMSDEDDHGVDRVSAARSGDTDVSPIVRRCPGGCPATDPRNDEPVLQRCVCAGPNDEAVRSRADAVEDDAPMRRSTSNAHANSTLSELDPATASTIARLRGSGVPLPPSTQHHFEQRLATDLSAVRVHVGAEAADLVARVHARAFTVGRDVFFGSGEFRPATATGRRLLAHELAHTLQQSPPGRVARDRPASASSGPAGVVQRTSVPAPEETPPPADLACTPATTGIADQGLAVLFPAGSAAVSDDQKPCLANLAANWHGTEASDEVVIRGYASAEGGGDYNWRLSCDRALRVAEVLSTLTDESLRIPSGFLSTQAAGETDRFADSLAANRRAMIDMPFSSSPVPPVPVAPATQPCFDLKQMTADTLGWSPATVDTWVEVVECACLLIKIADIFEDVVAKLPVVGRPFDNELVQWTITIADGLCAVWDWFQLIHKYGTNNGPCFDASSITYQEWGWIMAFFVTIPIDIFSSQVASLLITPLQRQAQLALLGGGTAAGGGGGGTAGSPGGPPGAAFGAIVGAEAGAVVSAILATKASDYIGFLGEMAFDLGTLATQEWIAHGTPLPTEGAGACKHLVDKAYTAAQALLEEAAPTSTATPVPTP